MCDQNYYRQSMARWDEKISALLKTQRADDFVEYIMDCYRTAAPEDQACFVAALAGQLAIKALRQRSHANSAP
ncbi:hypothetical protein [Acetobacter indonesiensis]|uniref:Uncharacterized protein n=1 Tax=Acetobacter indonesiensis TaxID=104101 RepID=A0A252AXN0_9PROT|nr:hypothetical protein [Acetobacter indonesiensis]OUI96314.1 hypothetical protein HK17_11855 [Acetobacter indonesiensis]